MKFNENKLHSKFHSVMSTRSLDKPHQINVYTNLFCKYAQIYIRDVAVLISAIFLPNINENAGVEALKIEVLLILKSSWEMKLNLNGGKKIFLFSLSEAMWD